MLEEEMLQDWLVWYYNALLIVNDLETFREYSAMTPEQQLHREAINRNGIQLYTAFYERWGQAPDALLYLAEFAK